MNNKHDDGSSTSVISLIDLTNDDDENNVVLNTPLDFNDNNIGHEDDISIPPSSQRQQQQEDHGVQQHLTKNLPRQQQKRLKTLLQQNQPPPRKLQQQQKSYRPLLLGWPSSSKNSTTSTDDSTAIAKFAISFNEKTPKTSSFHDQNSLKVRSSDDIMNRSDRMKQSVTISKRPRRVTHEHTIVASSSTSSNNHSTVGVPSTATNSTASSNLWCEKYRPIHTIDLCIAPKKIKEIIQWMNESLSSSSHYGNHNKLLIVVGAPGIGKSTMIKCIANEMNISISEWTESYSTYVSQQHQSQQQYSTIMDQQTPLQSFGQFLQQSGCGYQTLQLQDITSTTTTRTRSNNDDSSSNKYQTNNRMKRPPSSALSNDKDIDDSERKENNQSIILIDEIPYLHGYDAQQRFRAIMTTHIQYAVTPCIMIYSNVTEGKHRPADIEKLIDPHLLYDQSMVRIISIHPPTKSKFQKCIESILDKQARQQINNGLPSDTRMVKVNKPVGRQQQPQKQHKQQINDWIEELYQQCSGDIRSAINTIQFQLVGQGPSSIIQTLNHNDNKPYHKIMLRDKKLSSFHALGKLLYAKRKQIVVTEKRPLFLPNQLSNRGINRFKNNLISPQSQLHQSEEEGMPINELETNRNDHVDNSFALSQHDNRNPLDFDPEGVIEKCNDMDIDKILQFVQYHCIDFYTDIDELSHAMDHFSDAAVLLLHHHGYHSSSSDDDNMTSSTIFPSRYIGSLTSRSVAATNYHPAVSKFRQFNAPKSYEVYNKKSHNQHMTKQIIKQLSYPNKNCTNNPLNGNHSGSYLIQSDHTDFFLDIVPYGRRIVPSIGTEYQKRMQTFFTSKEDRTDDPSSITSRSKKNDDNNDDRSFDHVDVSKYSKNKFQHNHHSSVKNDDDEDDDITQWREQEEILLADDIVEDLDDD